MKILWWPVIRTYKRYSAQKILTGHFDDKHWLTLATNLELGGMKVKTYCELPRDEWLDFDLILRNERVQ